MAPILIQQVAEEKERETLRENKLIFHRDTFTYNIL